MKIQIETNNDVNISVVLDVVKGFIEKTDKTKNDLYFVQTNGMIITLKETSSGNINARAN
ncbi:hypothetical protein [Xenorhabdus cabanillasii]|uniref:Uncharacterized protein n=1 Tax=Xenorhabdus cabanillasii JM26 TaxID=1427517 RepID=W1J6F1_9GAMM|nr:hypothetical protein [Xenorhabdus cabanillasii]PHM76921.1 hypothetical protein Xcab_02488 [Xenorhabdus cabanillasii JM26]CDL86309.1 hypothetical protein XCR1_2980012 [Xenorhabdus cabanillasii JM26]